MNIGLMYDAIDVIETLCDCIRDTPASCDACYLNEYPEIELLRRLKIQKLKTTNELCFSMGYIDT